jgi:DNA/RNA-binding domain of Phe-tRNA-synthetase-like protein
MEFQVEPEVFARFPGMRLAVAVGDGADTLTGRPAVDARWRAAWRDAAAATAAHGNPQSHPRVRPWRERFRAMGVSAKDYPSSVEALLRRALKGGEPFQVNPLVDFYNTVSLEHVVPVGGFDLAALRGPLELRLTRAGDTFAALDDRTALAVPPGEVAYADGGTVLTRHFVWRQARTGLIAPGTRSFLLVSEILAEVGEMVATAVRDALGSGLARDFGLASRVFLLDERTRVASW